MKILKEKSYNDLATGRTITLHNYSQTVRLNEIYPYVQIKIANEKMFVYNLRSHHVDLNETYKNVLNY